MKLYARLDQIRHKLHPAFSRGIPFEKFVLRLWELSLDHQPTTVTGYMNGIGFGESSYDAVRHCFHPNE